MPENTAVRNRVDNDTEWGAGSSENSSNRGNNNCGVCERQKLRMKTRR